MWTIYMEYSAQKAKKHEVVYYCSEASALRALGLRSQGDDGVLLLQEIIPPQRWPISLS